MKPLRLRHHAAIISGLCLALFAIVVWCFEIYLGHDVEGRVVEYSDFLASPLWRMDRATSQEYLSLITRTEAFEQLRLLHPDGELFAEAGRSVQEWPMEGTFRKLRLIHADERLSPIHYQGQLIGRLESKWLNRNIYFHLAAAPLFATLALGLIVSRYLRHLRDRDRDNLLHLEQEKVKLLQSRRALERTEQRYKNIIEDAKDIIYECDARGRFTFINSTTTKILHYKREDLLGKNIGKMVSPEYRGDLLRHYRDQMARGRKNSYREFPILTAEREEIWIGQNVQLVYDGDEVTGFQAVARDITDLKNAMRMLAERDEKMNQELQLARQIQQSLIPISVPYLRGFEFGLRFIPSGVIGGDYVSFVEYPDNKRLGVMFADITGHGVAAALLSAMLKVLVDEVMHTGASPSSAFNMLNKRISQEYPEGNYVSAFYAIFDSRQNNMTYVKASQEPVYHIHADGKIDCLEEGGPALGLLDPFCFGDPEYEQYTVELDPGDTVFFYTDGLIELWDEQERALEHDALVGWLSEEKTNNPQDLVDAMYERAIKFAGTSDLADDVAELAVRRSAP